jgi:hypothetical protein
MWQVLRGNQLNEQDGLSPTAEVVAPSALSVQANFMKIPFGDDTFDAVYAIEATCHAPNREGVYSEILRVLKPGGRFACYEWCLTDKYDATNPEHAIIKKQIEEGDALPDMAGTGDVVDALKAVGFDVVATRDMALDDHQVMPWYVHKHHSLYAGGSRHPHVGRDLPLNRALTLLCVCIWQVPSARGLVQPIFVPVQPVAAWDVHHAQPSALLRALLPRAHGDLQGAGNAAAGRYWLRFGGSDRNFHAHDVDGRAEAEQSIRNPTSPFRPPANSAVLNTRVD